MIQMRAVAIFEIVFMGSGLTDRVDVGHAGAVEVQVRGVTGLSGRDRCEALFAQGVGDFVFGGEGAAGGGGYYELYPPLY